MSGQGSAGRGAVILIVALVGGCRGGGGAARPTGGPSCRAVAQATERFVAAAPDGAPREATLRFAVEVIDLCQAPGLPVATRKCVAGAASAVEARACPALPVVPLRGERDQVMVHEVSVDEIGDESDDVDAIEDSLEVAPLSP